MGGKNQRLGSDFEKIFHRLCLYSRILPKKQELSARRLPRGRVKVLKSDLDYRLINRNGVVGFWDLKSYADPFFYFSELEPHQVAQAVTLNEWNVRAGFIVWFRKPNMVTVFSGQYIAQAGPGSRFTYEQGVNLGKLEAMNLGLLFA